MNKATESALSRPDQNTDITGDRADADVRRRRFNDLLGRGLFETVIVAVGVFLALMVDEWREDAERKELADEARTALRAELLANRDALVDRFRTTAAILSAADERPEGVGQFVFERRNRPLLVNDTAWTMTVETGAIRWLEPEERAMIARVYSGHERMREVVANELVRWTELAGFVAEQLSPDDARDRDRAIRIWQAYAQRTQFALCMNLGRHEQALGALIPNAALNEYCVRVPATRPPEDLYRDWAKRDWVSSSAPQLTSARKD